MLIFAHRGASGEFPENTLLAFEQAIEQQADGIELDVQRHPDGTLFLLHDRYLDGKTTGTGHFSQSSSAKISKHSVLPDQPIATLNQALQCINGRCLVNIELKSNTDDLIEQRQLIKQIGTEINQALTHYGFNEQQFIISSFNHHLLLVGQQLLPNIARAALIAHQPINLAATLAELKISSINPAIDSLSENIITQAKQLGLNIWVYTVDKIEDIKRCQDLDIDAIFTNHPQRSRQIINNLNST